MCMAIRRLESLCVGDVMNDNVLTVSKNDRMQQAASRLADYGLTAAPVIDEDGRCVGMLSATDFIRENADKERQPPGQAALNMGWTPEDLVSEHMTTAVQTVDVHQPLLKAAEIMCVQHVHRIPALDGQGRPRGIVSTMDIVAALVNAVDEMRIRAQQPE